MNTVVQNTNLMLHRRGCTKIIVENCKLKDVGEFSIAMNPTTMEHVSVYFVNRDEKVSIVKVRNIIKNSTKHSINRVIIIHDLPFTSESKHTVQVNVVFTFELFTYDDMMYDPLSIIDHPYELYTGPPLKEISKIPKICDIITKYMAFPAGSVVHVKDFRTEIPCLYVVLKSIGDDVRKK